jgi:hypothetical protein
MLRNTWVIPFIFLAVVLAIYLFAPAERRAALQQRIRDDINFHLIADLVLVLLAIASTLLDRQPWLRAVAWLVLIVAIAAGVRRIFARQPTAPPTAFDAPDDTPAPPKP